MSQDCESSSLTLINYKKVYCERPRPHVSSYYYYYYTLFLPRGKVRLQTSCSKGCQNPTPMIYMTNMGGEAYLSNAPSHPAGNTSFNHSFIHSLRDIWDIVCASWKVLLGLPVLAWKVSSLESSKIFHFWSVAVRGTEKQYIVPNGKHGRISAHAMTSVASSSIHSCVDVESCVDINALCASATASHRCPWDCLDM